MTNHRAGSDSEELSCLVSRPDSGPRDAKHRSDRLKDRVSQACSLHSSPTLLTIMAPVMKDLLRAPRIAFAKLPRSTTPSLDDEPRQQPIDSSISSGDTNIKFLRNTTPSSDDDSNIGLGDTDMPLTEVQLPQSLFRVTERLPRWHDRKWPRKSEYKECVQVQLRPCIQERLPRWNSAQQVDQKLPENQSESTLACEEDYPDEVDYPQPRCRLPRWRDDQLLALYHNVGQKVPVRKNEQVPDGVTHVDGEFHVTPRVGVREKMPRYRCEWTLENATPFKHQCETLYTQGNLTGAVDCLIAFADVTSDAVRIDKLVADWMDEFAHQYVLALERNGKEVLILEKHGEAIAAFSTALSLRHLTPTQDTLLITWTRTMLIHNSSDKVLDAATRLGIPKFVACRTVCDVLEEDDRVLEAVACFQQMKCDLASDVSPPHEQTQWQFDLCRRLSKKLEHLGDIAVDAKRHDEAISHYTTALSLDPPSSQGILIKRSSAFVVSGSWKESPDDANQAIALGPSSPWGYEVKRAALHTGRKYDDAIDPFEEMLSKIAQSPHLDVQERGDQYISPSITRETIREIVQKTIRRLPRVLINTTTGRLQTKAEQASSFECLPIFKELVLSMTTRIDYVRIKREVRKHFRYVMLSHKWEENEPLFKLVADTPVYDLGSSPTHVKLKTFCEIVRDGGFIWAWSDTCCIDKSDHFVLQEALVAMFKWYEGSALTIVFLRGVYSLAQLGALVKSLWNSRAWTLQEYIASKIVHFYTEDWTFYLNLELPNHKESPEIISEMQRATGVSAEELKVLRPGLTNIREKLRLASTRRTTLVEDAAYSLLGIFSVTGLPAIYGEGESSLGRLLANVLTDSGDVSILAWTGESGTFNSCLPARITVFNGVATSHLPSLIPDAEMDLFVSASHSSPFDLDIALGLYDSLSVLPAPWFAASRMKLPCIAFQLPSFSSRRTRSRYVCSADTDSFGRLEIKTRQDLSRMGVLYLVHPWLDALLEPGDIHGHMSVGDDVALPWQTDLEAASDEEFDEDEPLVSGPELRPQADMPMRSAGMVPMDREMCARRLVARLRQPFGALLVTPTGTGRRATPDYWRVAADSLVRVQFQESVSLADVLDNVRTLDVL